MHWTLCLSTENFITVCVIVKNLGTNGALAWVLLRHKMAEDIERFKKYIYYHIIAYTLCTHIKIVIILQDDAILFSVSVIDVHRQSLSIQVLPITQHL